MNRGRWQELVDQLRGTAYQFGLIVPGSPVHHVEFEVGLTDAEVAAAENRFEFRFPPDLREFLRTALPHGPGFPDWRAGEEAALRDWLDQPRQGILFDVEHNGFWLNEWGPRPSSLKEASRVASALIAAAPRLIPVHGHRMMPDEPREAGNPIFSVHQTDIMCYGFDLADYLRDEFGLPGREPWPARAREWRADEHGAHCRFANRRTGQVVEAPLPERIDAGRVDPYFLALFVRSTAGPEPVVELLAQDFHDAARILDIVGDGGALDAEPAASPDRVELGRSRAAWVVPRLARSFVRRRRREVMMKIVGYVLVAFGGLMILGTLNMGMTQYDLSSRHDQSKFIGGLGISALILVLGLALARKAKR